MSDIYSRMEQYINEHSMIADGVSLLAAVSGGADSMCMLDLLIRYAAEHSIRLGVVHVNHGFREESVSEAEYVESFCRDRGIAFFLESIEPGSISHAEEAARDRRYALITETARINGYDRIALAHNARDRAETVLFNMIRGTGIGGMMGIKPVRDIYIRPILCLNRDEIEAYLQTQGIAYCTDITNLGDDYARNRIRHHIITEAESINAGSVRHINELAEDAGEICELIAELAQKAYVVILSCSEDGTEKRVDIKEYINLRPLIRAEIIRMAIRDMTPHLKDITREHISSIDELAYRDTNARVDLPYGIQAYREYDHISIVASESTGAEVPDPDFGPYDSFNTEVNTGSLTEGGEPLIIPLEDGSEAVFALLQADTHIDESGLRSVDKYTKRFDYDKINKPISIRSRKDGDRIVIDEAGHIKKLSRYMIESKIPVRQRERIPLLTAGSDVIWIIGYRDSYAYRIDDTTHRILEVTVNHKSKENRKDG